MALSTPNLLMSTFHNGDVSLVEEVSLEKSPDRCPSQTTFPAKSLTPDVELTPPDFVDTTNPHSDVALLKLR